MKRLAAFGVLQRFAFLCGLAFLGVPVLSPLAMNAGGPPRALEAVAELLDGEWQALWDGLTYQEASTALGTRLTLFRIDPSKLRLEVVQQKKSKGERARSVIERTDALVAVNGGFFARRDNGDLFPVGYVRDDGKALSSAWTQTGGYLVLGDHEAPKILPSERDLPADAREVLQSRPIILEPGSKWAMRTNEQNPEKRTLICRQEDGTIILMLVWGQGLSLYEAGWLFRDRDRGGVFGCDSALALDGGGSTQLAVKDHPELDVAGLTPVQNLIAVMPR
jgi:exopolysaccharide biosynthesis protein